MLLSRRITIIAGHYGSGKTEFAVNLALSAAKSAQVTLADLDIVNPYFCSREREEELADAGVTLIAPAKSTHHADVPALPPEMARIFADQDRFSIIDAGGDDAGARVLGRYRPSLTQPILISGSCSTQIGRRPPPPNRPLPCCAGLKRPARGAAPAWSTTPISAV